MRRERTLVAQCDIAAQAGLRTGRQRPPARRPGEPSDLMPTSRPRRALTDWPGSRVCRDVHAKVQETRRTASREASRHTHLRAADTPSIIRRDSGSQVTCTRHSVEPGLGDRWRRRGEKDVDRRRWKRQVVIGLRTTFSGRRVVVIPDIDRTGEEHAEDVAARLHEQGAEIRVLRLRNLPRKGDVSDWLDAGGTADELSRLSEQATPWRPTLPELSFDAVDAVAFETAQNRRRVLTSSLTAVEKLLLIVLLEPDHARCPQRTMANYLGVTERRVRQLIAGLKQRGVLAVVRLRRGNAYRVQPHELPTDDR